jgi:hypothetical protein
MNPHPLSLPAGRQALSHRERGENIRFSWCSNRVRAVSIALLILSFTLLSSGCARTVTQLVTFGKLMQVEVTLRGTMKIDGSARYFMVLSRYKDFVTPLPFPDNINSFEFIEPGTSPQIGSAADYYTNFYNKWDDYVIVEPSKIDLVKGLFIQGQNASRETIGVISTVDQKISFTIPLESAFGASANIPDTIYFDVASVNWPYGAAKYAIDHLNSTNAYISKITGSITTVTDEYNLALDPGMDIISITAVIQ